MEKRNLKNLKKYFPAKPLMRERESSYAKESFGETKLRALSPEARGRTFRTRIAVRSPRAATTCPRSLFLSLHLYPWLKPHPVAFLFFSFNCP